MASKAEMFPFDDVIMQFQFDSGTVHCIWYIDSDIFTVTVQISNLFWLLDASHIYSNDVSNEQISYQKSSK